MAHWRRLRQSSADPSTEKIAGRAIARADDRSISGSNPRILGYNARQALDRSTEKKMPGRYGLQNQFYING